MNADNKSEPAPAAVKPDNRPQTSTQVAHLLVTEKEQVLVFNKPGTKELIPIGIASSFTGFLGFVFESRDGGTYETQLTIEQMQSSNIKIHAVRMRVVLAHTPGPGAG